MDRMKSHCNQFFQSSHCEPRRGVCLADRQVAISIKNLAGDYFASLVMTKNIVIANPLWVKQSLTLFFCLLLIVAFPKATSAEETSKILPLPQNISDSLPWFAVREFGGVNAPFTKIHLQEMASKSNRTALVYFATWCVPCRAGINKLVQNKRNLEQNNIKVVLVNVGERDEDLIKKWIKEMHVEHFKIALDAFGRTTEGFGLVKESSQMDLPKTLVLDKNTKPLFLIGEEGEDFPQVIWKNK